jgi:hypothetical protein
MSVNRGGGGTQHNIYLIFSVIPAHCPRGIISTITNMAVVRNFDLILHENKADGVGIQFIDSYCCVNVYNT